MNDDFAEFDTPPAEVLRMLNEGEPVTFGVKPKMFVTFDSPMPAGLRSWSELAQKNSNPNSEHVAVPG